MNPEIAKAIAAIRSQGGNDADVEAYLRSIGAEEVSPETQALQKMVAEGERASRASEREAKTAEERKLTPGQRVGAGVQNALGMASFGLGNLGGDALDALFSDRTFAANRQARRMTNEATPMRDRLLSTVAGAVVNPAGALVKAPAGAGLLMRGGVMAGDAALQSGATTAVESLDEFSPEGLKRAGQQGLMSAAVAVPMVGTMQAGLRGLLAANTMRRVFSARPIDQVAFEMKDAMARADEALYGAVRSEASAAGTTPAIQAVLESKTVRPFANIVRNEEAFEGLNDAETLIETYKLMSEAQNASLNRMSGTQNFLARESAKKKSVGKAKSRMMAAAVEPGEVVVPGRARVAPPPTTAQSPNPTVREAIEAHRTRLGQTVTRREGTAMQQTAREALERHDTENIVSPSLTGAPQELRAVTRPSETVQIPGALPSFPQAVNTHRIAASESDAFLKTADAVRRILEGNSVSGKKLTINSPEALRREIAKMTPAQAERALQATLGRGREVARLTANPVGKFGLVSSFARSLHAPFQIDPFVKLLEKQAGYKASLFDNPVVQAGGRAAAARTLGGLLSVEP